MLIHCLACHFNRDLRLSKRPRGGDHFSRRLKNILLKIQSGLKIVKLVLFDQATIDVFIRIMENCERGIIHCPFIFMITSPQNSKIKLVRALLGRAKERRDAGAFLAEGVRLVEEAVNSELADFKFVLYDETLNERGKLQVESLKVAGH